MYLVVIAWTYVVLLMSVAEATNSTGSVLGALVTFVLYGLLPISIVVYLMRAPARNKAIKKRAAEELAQAQAQALSRTSQTSEDKNPATESDDNKAQQEKSTLDPNASQHSPSTGQTIDTRVAPVREIP
jgi:hypothetical protein